MFGPKTKQVQILQENYRQIAKNNFEAIMLSFNRVLYLLGYHDFISTNQLEITGQNLNQMPNDINIEFDILLFSMLNLKQIPGLSENDQLKLVEDNLFQFYLPLKQNFVGEIFQLSLYSIKGNHQQAKCYFLQLKNKYPQSFTYSSESNNDKRNYPVSQTDTSQFQKPIPDNQVLESVQHFCKAQHQGDQLIIDQLQGKIKDEEYNKNLYKAGIIKKSKK